MSQSSRYISFTDDNGLITSLLLYHLKHHKKKEIWSLKAKGRTKRLKKPKALKNNLNVVIAIKNELLKDHFVEPLYVETKKPYIVYGITNMQSY